MKQESLRWEGEVMNLKYTGETKASIRKQVEEAKNKSKYEEAL